jgi:DNA helicase-2/ATP-dependent DNA helicase PcrA
MQLNIYMLMGLIVQDTNTTQYNLMKAFAKQGNVTIVGDPDQAIYSWRAAGKLRLDSPSTTLVPTYFVRH